MRARQWTTALALVPLAALGAGAEDQAPLPDRAFLEFLAEEPAVDEELSEALMTDRLDREIERSTRRREVQSDVKNEG